MTTAIRAATTLILRVEGMVGCRSGSQCALASATDSESVAAQNVCWPRRFVLNARKRESCKCHQCWTGTSRQLHRDGAGSAVPSPGKQSSSKLRKQEDSDENSKSKNNR